MRHNFLPGLAGLLLAGAATATLISTRFVRKARAGREDVPVTWTPGVRLLVGATGCALFSIGMTRGGLIGLASSVVGAGLLTRATINLPVKRLIGVGAGPHAVDFDTSIQVDVPPHEVFEFFRDFRNFPRFMSHLDTVDVDGSRSHWKAIGPAGVRVGWHAEITRVVENGLIAWKSVDGSLIQSAGVVHFMPDARGGTLLNVRMTHHPPGGALGLVIASLFRADPKKALDDDLL